MKKLEEVGFLGGDSSLIGADTSMETRLPIKGTVWARRASGTVANTGMARSSMIGTATCSVGGDPKSRLTTGPGANGFCISRRRAVS